VTIFGAQAHARAGYALASGDFNGDGNADIVISSDGLFPLGGTRTGEFDIIWGTELQTGGSIDLANSDGISRIFGWFNSFPLLCSLGSGDFNNDGFDDIIIGEPLWQFRGLVHVVFGAPIFPDTLDLHLNPANVITMVGPPDGWLGFQSCSCDVDGDGFEDMVISAPGLDYGQAYIIRGADSLSTIYDMGQPQPNVTRIIDDNYLQFTGYGLACNDIDKDGYDDLLIGAPGQISGAYDGIVTLLHGEATLPDTISLLNTSFRVNRLFGEYSHGLLGNEVAIGDIDGNGNQDLVLAATYADPLGCRDCGEVYIIYDAETLPESTLVNTASYPITRIIGSGPYYRGSNYGREILCEDFSGDGYDDVVFSGQYIDNIPTSRDTVVVYYGEATPPDSIFVASDTTVSRVIAERYLDDMGQEMTSGDYNSDGLPDLVLGTYSYDEGGSFNVGRAYIIYGIRRAPMNVAVDIKPGACPNSLDTSKEPRDAISKKGGVLPVAVLGSETFDVTAIDLASLRLEDVTPLSCHLRDVAAPSTRGEDCAYPNTVPDGRDDLMLYFRRAEIADSIGPVHTGDVIELALTGLLNDGTPIRGTDCVTIVGPQSESPRPEDHGGIVFRKPVPNPFNPTTRISYSLPTEGLVILSIYDLAGRLVENLVDGVKTAGEHVVEWDASAMPSGIYFCRMQVGDFSETRKLVLLK
jgi:hypothetical protein